MTRSHRRAQPHRRAVLAATTALALVAAAVETGAIAAAAGGGPLRNGHYKGTSGPGYPLSFRVSPDGRTVEHLVVAYNPTCSPGAGSTPFEFHFGPLPIHAGTFSGHAVDHSGTTVTESLHITGDFAGRTASGKVTNTSMIKSLKTCTDRSPFTATAG